MPRGKKKEAEVIEEVKETSTKVSLEELSKKVKKLTENYKSVGSPEFIKSGSVVLDAILGGGIPRGTFISWSATHGCGKSTAALHVSRVYCMQGKRVLYLDYEGGVNSSQIDGMGLREFKYDPETNPEGTFFVFQVQTYKDGETILDSIMDDIDLVVIDSATAILTEKVKGASSEDILPGIDSRIMSIFLKKYKAEAIRKGTTWIIINQLRTKIAMGYGQQTKEEEAGGNALKFYPDIKLAMKPAYKGQLERVEETSIGEQKVPFGRICEIWAEKNRYERPKIPMKLAVIFGKGVSNEFAYADVLENDGIIVKSGAWYTIKLNGETSKVQGLNGVIGWITSHREEVKDYINSVGGYRLLMNQESNVDLTEEMYDTETIEPGEISGEE
jgi:recombination protein RecA|nr:MAG TPA: Protein recA [Bacteriophage sp.]